MTITLLDAAKVCTDWFQYEF